MYDLWKSKDILEYFKSWDLDEESSKYLAFNYKRYEFLLKIINKYIAQLRNKSEINEIKILDIGPSFQTELIRKVFPDTIVNTIGFKDTRYNKLRSNEKLYEFDLNRIQFKEEWPKTEQHDLVFMGEVFEHLFISPQQMFACTKTWLKMNGYFIMQTPNALALLQRLKMIVGIHPYGKMHESVNFSGHFREYELDDLIKIAEIQGFKADYYSTKNLFNYKVKMGIFYNFVCNILPESFRDDMTICFESI